MDSLTHFVMGAAIGELTLGKKVGKKALIWGGLAANIPDIDGIFQYLFSPASSTLFHRGISHSLLLMVLLAPLIAWGINRMYKGNKNSFKGWFKLVFFAWASHLCLDVFNTYGTGLFEPFSHVRVAYDAIGISDLFFVLPLIVAAVISFVSRKTSKLPQIVSVIALTFSFLYLGLTIMNKQHIESFTKAELDRQHIPYSRVLTSPLPITNFAWTVVAEDENGFWKGTYSATTEDEIKFHFIPKNYNLASDIQDVKDFKTLQRFSKGYYVLRKGSDNNIILSDLRFGSLGGNSTNGVLGGGLNFTMQTNDNGDLIIERSHPDRNVTPASVKQYIKRISKRH